MSNPLLRPPSPRTGFALLLDLDSADGHAVDTRAPDWLAALPDLTPPPLLLTATAPALDAAGRFVTGIARVGTVIQAPWPHAMSLAPVLHALAQPQWRTGIPMLVCAPQRPAALVDLLIGLGGVIVWRLEAGEPLAAGSALGVLAERHGEALTLAAWLRGGAPAPKPVGGTGT